MRGDDSKYPAQGMNDRTGDLWVPPGRPPIVCICGSMRFYHRMQVAAKRWTLSGWIVLMPLVDKFELDATNPDASTVRKLTEGLDELHRWKIAMSDRVIVVAPDGYVGDSTKGEIEYAEQIDIPVQYVEG